MHYGSTVYLGMIWVVLDQFRECEHTAWHHANRDREEPKERHSSTKVELGYTLICNACLEYAGDENQA